MAYLCLTLNMINFDEVDFSERRSEVVISFFWRSVYIGMKQSARVEYMCCFQMVLTNLQFLMNS